jgi:pimeloyl-ACP methyl ester carboxylesterase
VEGLAALIHREGLEKVIVYGGSYGGFLAQLLVRHSPEKVKGLILSHTTPPNPRRGRTVAVAAPLLDWTPDPILRALFRRSLSGLMRTPDRRLRRSVRAYFRHLSYSRSDRLQITSAYRRILDFDRHKFTPHDLQNWPGKILLLLSEDDPLTPAPVRQALAKLYPQAEIRLFSGSGHLSSMLNMEEFTGAIESFLGYKPETQPLEGNK